MTTATTVKSIYFFGGTATEGTGKMRETLGGKGANLAEMTNLGIPVPEGFTISTNECTKFYQNGNQLSQELVNQLSSNIQKVEQAQGKYFGDSENPLLFSVRSGSRVSMPGMMDTVLNLGLNDNSVKGLASRSGSERFAWDSYRRFIQMFSNVVLGLEHHDFEHILGEKKSQNNIEEDTDLTVEALKEIVSEYKSFLQQKGVSFPQEPIEQLKLSVAAVFKSWNADRAIKYRKINRIPSEWGTAVNVQAMVFGNLGETSGTGVAFTRDPGNGENRFYGEYLINAQGEDVVAGIRTPQPISQLENQMPEVYGQLETIYKKLESHFRDMQDLEFTIEDKKLYLLQTRNGKRTAEAAINIAVDMVNEGLIDKNEALLRVAPDQIDQLLHPMIDPSAEVNPLTKGLPASPGAAVGKVVFTSEDAEEWAARGEDVVLVRSETSPEDIGGMNVAQGILTARGGMTSHAAVVARGMGKCCVAGCSALDINASNKTVTISGKTLTEGDFITLNGTTGEVVDGKVPLKKPELSENFSVIMAWADDVRTMKVRTNAETEQDTKVAREFGAEGIGLCRTEHMFFEPSRIKAVRKMILSNTIDERRAALAIILPMQKGDFISIFTTMEGLPVTVRLLDPPLHEFLPHDAEAMSELANELNLSVEDIKKKVESLTEMNPMLGHRGCRLGITFPEIYEMQVRAIIEAAVELTQQGKDVQPEIMVPLICEVNELSSLKKLLISEIERVFNEKGTRVDYQIGTMIEIPRAALLADEVAAEAEFFSFGTNDLTQMTFGVSRDDSGMFLPEYVEKGILKDDPFQVLDQRGVGQLIKIAVESGRRERPNLKIGICGEHGGEPSSVEFCYNQGFDYVSCSPYRVPIARLAAAHAVLKKRG